MCKRVTTEIMSTPSQRHCHDPKPPAQPKFLCHGQLPPEDPNFVWSYDGKHVCSAGAFENLAGFDAARELGEALPAAVQPVIETVTSAAAGLPALVGATAGPNRDTERLTQLQAVSGRVGWGYSQPRSLSLAYCYSFQAGSIPHTLSPATCAVLCKTPMSTCAVPEPTCCRVLARAWRLLQARSALLPTPCPTSLLCVTSLTA